jgi:uncharacterized protein
MNIYPSDDGKAAFVRLDRGTDLLTSLTEAATKLSIEAGTVQAIGAVDDLTVAFFEPGAKEYEPIPVREHLEITSSLGNVSLRDGKPFIHVHVTAGRRDGTTVGGHLLEGSTVFMIEAYFRALGGPAPVREIEDDIGLAVWQ